MGRTPIWSGMVRSWPAVRDKGIGGWGVTPEAPAIDHCKLAWTLEPAPLSMLRAPVIASPGSHTIWSAPAVWKERRDGAPFNAATNPAGKGRKGWGRRDGKSHGLTPTDLG